MEDKILTNCSGCSAKFKVGSSFVGKKVKCTKCQTVFVISQPQEEQAELIEEERQESQPEQKKKETTFRSRLKSKVSRVYQESKSAPTGVAVISVLIFVLAFLSVLRGLSVILRATFATVLFPAASLFGGAYIIGGIFIVGLGVLEFFVGLYLLKGQNWARMVVIVLTCINGLIGLMELSKGGFVGIGLLAVRIGILIYLLTNEKGKAFFKV